MDLFIVKIFYHYRGKFGKKTCCCKILVKSTCVIIFQSPINSGTCKIERTNIVIVDLLIK